MTGWSLAEVQEAVARRVPDRPALVWRDRTITFAELSDRSRRLAGVLRGAGLGNVCPRRERWQSGQDHVALYMRNRPEWLEALLGCFKARCVPFNVNYRYVSAEIEHLFALARPRAVVFESVFAPVMQALPLEDVFLVQVDGDGDTYEDALAMAEPVSPDGWSGDDLHAVFTGGTTGLPKAVLWRQADLFVAALGGASCATIEDVVMRVAGQARPALPVPPFMHATAQWNALGALLQGDTVVAQDVVDRFDPHDVLRTAERHRVKMLTIVGDTFARPLLDALAATPYDLSELRVVMSSGAALSLELKRRMVRALPNVTVLDTAGSSEGGAQMVQRVRAGGEPAVSVFEPAPGTVVLSDDRTRALVAGDAEAGWLARRGSVPLGYLGDPVRTAETFPEVDGVRHVLPGDRAVVTATGRIELLGRDAVTINRLS